MDTVKNVLFKEGWFFLLIIFIFKVSCFDITFFWDSINCLSRVAHHIYDNGLSYFCYEEKYDNGDPHILPFYIATLWSLMGKNLIITHLAFLPFTLGCVYQVVQLSRKLFTIGDSNNLLFFLLSTILILSDTSFLSQIILLGTDVCVIFFALYTVNQILKGGYLTLSVGFVGLLITRRGMIISAVLMITYLLHCYFVQKKEFKLKSFLYDLLPTLPACLFVLLFLVLRYMNVGWVFNNPVTVWAETGDLVTKKELLKNGLVYVWRNLDFGRFAIWGVFLFSVLKSKKIFFGELKTLWFAYFLLQMAFLIVTLPITNPFGARYFIVQFVLFSAIVSKIVYENFDKKVAKGLMITMIVIVNSGHFWLYPLNISQNWDCTLKHISFYDLRKETFEYLENNGIDYSNVASGFSLYGNQRLIDLKDEDRVIDSEIGDNEYYLYSNICSERDERRSEFCRDWEQVALFQKNDIFIQILKK